MHFLSGNQYFGIDGRGELYSEANEYFWQKKSVFNHIAPIIETRLARFARVKPVLKVRPKSDDDDDVQASIIAEKLVGYAFKRCNLEEKVRRVTAWSESCGTGFYKICWNNLGGDKVGIVDGEDVYEGEVEILCVSPFEIFPDNLYSESLDDIQSIIHAKAVPVKTIKEKYGESVVGREIGIFDLDCKSSNISAGKEQTEKTLSDAEIVIEYYEKPSIDFPNGRLITVAGDKLLYYGELPYVNVKTGKKELPFVKQESCKTTGNFFGTSIIERLIPVQRAYNTVKNRKHEFMNRLSMGIMTVEDGSIDVDDLSDDGLKPGKVIVYRQGAKGPEMMKETSLPPDFDTEEDKLANEFVMISGVSEVSSNSKNASLSSGSALQMLIEQDNERLTMNAETIRNCYKQIALKVLRLYAQFISGIKALSIEDNFDKTKIIYAESKSALSDDVYLASENELLYTPTQKNEMILKLLDSGLLYDEQGVLRESTKEQVLTLLGYSDLDYSNGLANLQLSKAQNENVKLRKISLPIEEIDDHTLHIDEHTRYVLSEYDELNQDEKNRVFMHISEHKNKLNQEKQNLIKTEE